MEESGAQMTAAPIQTAGTTIGTRPQPLKGRGMGNHEPPTKLGSNNKTANNRTAPKDPPVTRDPLDLK